MQKWKRVYDDGEPSDASIKEWLVRYPVPGGWLYRSVTVIDGYMQQAMSFVPVDNPWVPAVNTVPDDRRTVMVNTLNGHGLAKYHGKWVCAMTGETMGDTVTHWCELPELPA